MYNELRKRYPKGFVHGLVAGHGGIDSKGKYYIIKEGSKQHTFDDGLTIYEGEQNRIIKDTTLQLAGWENKLTVIDITPGYIDYPLDWRRREIERLKDFYVTHEGKLLIVWELHLNAFSNSKVSGKEIYTTTKHNFSDEMGQVWWNVAEELIPEQKDRPDFSDGDADKEVDFWLIDNISTFGVLIEFLFFTNREEVNRYLNPSGYAKLAHTLIKSMLILDSRFNDRSFK